MLKIKHTVLAAMSATLLFTACSKEPSYKKTDSGLQYYFYEDKEGPNAKVGDFVTLHFIYKCKDTTGKDSVLRNTWKDGMPIQVVVQPITFKGGLEEGLQMLSVGDSVTFKINTDSLFKNTFMVPKPAFIDGKEPLTFYMKAIKIQNKEEFDKDQASVMEERKRKMEEQMAKQKSIDDSLITAFVQANGISLSKTESGLYYNISQKGKGSAAKANSKVTVHYLGKLLNGKVFDSSIGKEPIEFTLGVGQVIPGWDEGLALLNEGSKALFVIPSSLGYGPMPNGEIPPFSILVFEVELLKVKN